jgi:hypothetical protein
MGMNFFDAAATLVSVGFKVFPLVPGAKLPLVKVWQKVATDDADLIGEWANKWPNANIGVATGDVVVIDLDVKDGRNGMQDLAALARTGKALPPSPIAVTPSGGRHLYFRAAPGVRNIVGISGSGRGLGNGVDVRASGGFVVAPPSELANCQQSYRWLVPPMTPEFPRLPEWALKMLLPPPARPRPAFATDARAGNLEGPAVCVARTPNGRRNNVLFWAACRAGEMVANHAISERAAIARLTDAANAAGLTGLDAPKAQLTIRSGLKTGQRDGGQS